MPLVSGLSGKKLDGVHGDTIFHSAAVLAASTAEAVFLPAANTKGAVLDWWSLVSGTQAAGSAGYGVYVGPAAPTVWSSPGAIAKYGDAAPAGKYVNMDSSRKYYIPPGWGVWFLSAVAEVSGHRDACYKIL